MRDPGSSCSWGANPPKSLFKKGKVAVCPSGFSPAPSSGSVSWSPPSTDIISPEKFSRSSSESPISLIMSSTCLMPRSLAHFRQSPSLVEVSFSIFVIKITATFFLQRLQSVGFINSTSSFQRGSGNVKSRVARANQKHGAIGTGNRLIGAHDVHAMVIDPKLSVKDLHALLCEDRSIALTG